ncbi:sia-alpha-2,3-Gal-beta-1,4-GlcNAc-R:alpha 2,8-sialyltransferase-like isoform X2 [Asterias rubens]|uniref:sia-alpha-2,3-Gal-beta-1,4-GlcNAc-R:alpha 2,8-sialyltransferase-like isoform X2 n=1 Tax=Asterias rubens TaxID=7604 RepID=UPI00145542D2|nr:sia-alpha-2,3-Gal-beta-1,4-GlcNAc-R:alpha 2,8-sialyltransferase-like isoform X2 [Asterias rubens]
MDIQLHSSPKLTVQSDVVDDASFPMIEKHLAADDTHNIFGSKMLVRRLRRSCKKLLLLFMIGVTVCLGIVLHTSPQSVHLDQLQQAYEEFQSHVTTGLRHQENERLEAGDNDEDDDDDDDPRDDSAKAKLDAILNLPWLFNKQAADQARKDMKQYFNPYDVITMTSDDVSTGQLRRFYLSKKLNVNLVPPGLHRLLPKRLLFHNQHFKKCSLVGNSGVLQNSTCGNEIDSSDFVIRCNFASVEGYEKDVGTRTDVVTFNPSIIEKYKRLSNKQESARFESDLRKYDGKYVLWVPVFNRQYVTFTIRTLLDFFERHLGNLKNVQLAFPGNVLPDISDYWASQGVDEERISTGLLMYNMASALCDEIHMYGFYPFPEFNGKPIPYHYDHPSDRVGKKFDYGYKRYHELPDEFVYLKKLHKAGVVKLHVGECPNV